MGWRPVGKASLALRLAAAPGLAGYSACRRRGGYSQCGRGLSQWFRAEPWAPLSCAQGPEGLDFSAAVFLLPLSSEPSLTMVTFPS